MPMLDHLKFLVWYIVELLNNLFFLLPVYVFW